jgi:hypothetical protein
MVHVPRELVKMILRHRKIQMWNDKFPNLLHQLELTQVRDSQQIWQLLIAYQPKIILKFVLILHKGIEHNLEGYFYFGSVTMMFKYSPKANKRIICGGQTIRYSLDEDGYVDQEHTVNYYPADYFF